MTCIRIYPPVEITKLTRGSGKIHSPAVLTSWDEVLDPVENAAVQEFVKKQLDKKQEAKGTVRASPCAGGQRKRSLRFHLTSVADFAAFSKAMEQYLPKVEFLDNADLDQPPDEE